MLIDKPFLENSFLLYLRCMCSVIISNEESLSITLKSGILKLRVKTVCVGLSSKILFSLYSSLINWDVNTVNLYLSPWIIDSGFAW